MRLWSIHPQYLDAKGIVALWREGLLAMHVLLGNTKGYQHHPQLIRFKEQSSPIESIANYLSAVCDEAETRNYNFQRNKIIKEPKKQKPIAVTQGQMDYEWQHFLKKVKKRHPAFYKKWRNEKNILPHPLFTIIKGGIADWERP